MNPKREILRTCGLEGIRGYPAESPEVDLEFDTWIRVLNLTSWGTEYQFAALRFVLDTCLNQAQP